MHAYKTRKGVTYKNEKIKYSCKKINTNVFIE